MVPKIGQSDNVEAIGEWRLDRSRPSAFCSPASRPRGSGQGAADQALQGRSFPERHPQDRLRRRHALHRVFQAARSLRPRQGGREEGVRQVRLARARRRAEGSRAQRRRQDGALCRRRAHRRRRQLRRHVSPRRQRQPLPGGRRLVVRRQLQSAEEPRRAQQWRLPVARFRIHGPSGQGRHQGADAGHGGEIAERPDVHRLHLAQRRGCVST